MLLLTNQVATPATDPAPPGNAHPQPVAPASSNPAAPTTAQPSTPGNQPAEKPLTKADIDTALAQARREWQSQADKTQAALHRQYQQQIRELQSRAAQHLQAAGYEDPQALEQQWTIEQEAAQYRQIQTEAQQWARWNAYVGEMATAYGLQASDPRIQGAASAQDLQAKCLAAMQADVATQRQTLLTEAEQARKAAVDKKVLSGDLDTLNGAPASNASGFDASKLTLDDRDKLYQMAAKEEQERRAKSGR